MKTNSQALFPHLPERLSGLGTLAENLWWSWRPRARMLFKMLDRQAWKDSGHNPDKMLRDLPVEVLAAAQSIPFGHTIESRKLLVRGTGEILDRVDAGRPQDRSFPLRCLAGP